MKMRGKRFSISSFSIIFPFLMERFDYKVFYFPIYLLRIVPISKMLCLFYKMQRISCLPCPLFTICLYLSRAVFITYQYQYGKRKINILIFYNKIFIGNPHLLDNFCFRQRFYHEQHFLIGVAAL